MFQELGEGTDVAANQELPLISPSIADRLARRDPQLLHAERKADAGLALLTRPSHRAQLYVLSGKRIEKSRVIEEEATARLKDSPRLEVTLNLVRKEHHAELAGHNVKTLILKRQCQSICLFPLNSTIPRLPCLCAIKHRLILIGCDYPRIGRKAGCDRSCKNSGSCGRLQHIQRVSFDKSRG